MRTFAHSIDEFASWKGDKERRIRFLQALIGVVRIRTRTSFADAVRVDDFNEVAKIHPDIMRSHSPFGMAGNTCINKVALWVDKYQILRSEVGLLFEDGAAEKKWFTREARKHLGATPIFAKKSEYAAFQAADLLAYEYLHGNRAISAAGLQRLKFDELRKPLQALLESQPQSAKTQWGFKDKDSIEKAWLQDCSESNDGRDLNIFRL